MKSLKLLLAGAFLGVLLMNSGCGGKSDPAPSVEDAQLAKLSKTWKATAVTLNNTSMMTNAQAGYSNFTMTISGTPGQTASGFSFTTSGRVAGDKNYPWPSNGTFHYGTDPATLLIRDDTLPITYAVTDTQLQMTFTYNGPGYNGGRVTQVQGNWVMTFSPQ
jgi:hypothetical protein